MRFQSVKEKSDKEREKIAERVCKNKVKSFVDFSLQTPKLVIKKDKQPKTKRNAKSVIQKRISQKFDEFQKNLDQSPKTLRNSFKPDKIKEIASSAFKSS